MYLLNIHDAASCFSLMELRTYAYWSLSFFKEKGLAPAL
jgi:hypothetical protein